MISAGRSYVLLSASLAVALNLSLQVVAQDLFHVDVSQNHQIISQGVAGQGMLDRASTSAFAQSETFKQAVRDFGTGCLRWPNAGHDNLLITHWDNDHTIYYGEGDPYSTQSEGNIWDPWYNLSHAAPREELIDLQAFVDVVNATETDPLMFFTWRSGELFRTINGQHLFYRDPAPFRMDGSPMPPAEADLLSSREMQFLENRRNLKAYYEYGGPDAPVIQIGGEVFIGWDDDQRPWELTGENRGTWIAATLRAYFDDLNAYARSEGRTLRLMAQFKEANSGGHEIPTSTDFLRGEFDKLIEHTGDLMTYYGCSMHYRHDWSTWLNQSRMTWGFIVDGGEGTAQEIREWMRNYTAAAGFPGIDLIPHANAVGSAKTELIPNSYSRGQKGLVYTQFLMELIEAGFPYSCHYGGIKGDHLGKVGLSNGSATSFMASSGYAYNSVVYSAGLIGENVRSSNGRPARRIKTTLGAGNLDEKIKIMVLESSAWQEQLAANGGPLDPSITQVLHLYVLNKRDVNQTISVDLSENVENDFEVRRYAEGAEETAPEISPASNVVVRDSMDNSVLHVTATPYSMTRVRLFVKDGTPTTNRPPAFKTPVVFAAAAPLATAYSMNLTDVVQDTDGDPLQFTLLNGPGWINLAADGTLTGTPTASDAGLNSVEVEVSDGTDTDRAVLRIVVDDDSTGEVEQIIAGWHTGALGIADVQADGINATLSTTLGVGETGNDSNDQSWGSKSDTPLPGTDNGAFKMKVGNVMTLQLSNTATNALKINSLHLDYWKKFSGSPADFIVSYTGGDLTDAAPVELYRAANSASTYANHDIDLTAVLKDTQLAPGESLTLEIEFSNASGFSAGYVDNIALIGTRYDAPGPDSDGDGLPDEWERQYFGDSTSADPNGHSDNDAQTNGEEYIAGTDPTNAASSFTISAALEPPEFILQWNAVPGRQYQIYSSTNLVNDPFSTLLQNLQYPANAYTTTVDETRAFFRAEVSLE